MRNILLSACLVLAAASPGLTDEPAPPKVGDTAEDFTLRTPEGQDVTLSELAADGPAVIVVLRGWPGYQCPICSRQVAGLIAEQDKLSAAGAEVVLIYPGPDDQLDSRAREFMQDVKLPEGFHFVIDPGYAFTNAYHLRWDEPRETAYPSTFVVDADRKVHYALVSKTHGGRAAAADVVAAVKKAAEAGGNPDDAS